MSRFVDEIAKLADPKPKFLDPEEDFNVETTACVVERFDESLNIYPELSSLRQKTTVPLEDIDTRYTGKKISRECFNEAHETGTKSSSDNTESEDTVTEDLKCFKQWIPGCIDSQNCSQELNDDISSDVCDDSKENTSDLSDQSETGSESGEELETEDDMLTKFSHIDVNEEIEKGKAVEAQLGLWNKFCESRIKFQKIIMSANQLPQFDVWSDFKNTGDKNYSEALKKGPVAIKSLLDSMLGMQSQLFLNNPETKSFPTTADSSPGQERNEEISSELENESEKSNVQNKRYFLEGETKKRKLKFDEYGDILAKRFKKFGPYRNSVIQKWDDKMHLIAGRMSQKSFSAFNQSALMQISQILQDKQRLIRRTQLKRSVYRILGKNEENESSSHQCEEKNKLMDAHSKRDEHLNCHDSEIFDDDDFYRLLLKEVIETKTIGMDPDILRTHMELQRNRRKMKRKVDTKASKGRKLRYDTHPKMVNFMACVNSQYPEETRIDLFKRVFNQNPAVHVQ